MVARDHEALVGAWARNQPGQRLDVVAQPHVGVGRAGVAEDARPCRAADRHALDELGGLLDPAGVEHRACAQEHQPGGARLPGAGGKCCGMRAFEGQETAAGDVGDALDHAIAGAVDQQHLADQAACRARHQRAKRGHGGPLHTFGRDDHAQHEASLAQSLKNAACYHLVTMKTAVLLREFRANRYRGYSQPARTMFLICSHIVLCRGHEPSILSCPQAPAGHGALRAGGCVFFSRACGRHRPRAAARPRRAIQCQRPLSRPRRGSPSTTAGRAWKSCRRSRRP